MDLQLDGVPMVPVERVAATMLYVATHPDMNTSGNWGRRARALVVVADRLHQVMSGCCQTVSRCCNLSVSSSEKVCTRWWMTNCEHVFGGWRHLRLHNHSADICCQKREGQAMNTSPVDLEELL
jgi:hypothetical protein